MPKSPNIPHQVIVNYLLAGHTTREAKEHFSFENDNIANLRVHAAFKALGIQRPYYAEPRTCEYCGKEFVARDMKQRTCGTKECQNALILDWQSQNPNKVREALHKYRGTEKGRQNNIRMHQTRRQRGLAGSMQDRWNFAASEIKKSLRKLRYLAIRNPWEYRLQHVQKIARFERSFTPRNQRSFSSSLPSRMWQQALRAVQTTLSQHACASGASAWEKAVNRIAGAIRTGNTVRAWKQKNIQNQSR
jgi:hypothetical protein